MRSWRVLCVCFAVFICLFFLTAPEANAFGEEIFTYSVADGKATITSCEKSISGELVIPDTLGGYPVIAIGAGAFRDCKNLTTVTIPDSVTMIKNSAFQSCRAMTAVYFGKGLNSIGQGAFYYCTALTEVVIPDSVTFVDTYAFRNCSSLTTATVGASLTAIGEGMFCDCYKLTSVTLCGSVTMVAIRSFENCSRLQDVYISDPNAWSAVVINSSEFNKARRHIVDEEGNEVTQLVLNKSVTAISNGAFRNSKNITSVIIPENVETIGENAFYYCDSLETVVISDGVSVISNNAFYSCSKLKTVSLPGSVTHIGSSAFGYCKGLTSLTVPDSLTVIGSNAFSGCNLQDLYIADPNAWCNISFGDQLASPAYGAAKLHILDAEGNEVKQLILNSSVTKIPDYAFRNGVALSSVVIPDSVTAVGENAFRGCTALTSITLPDSVTVIDHYAFSGCTGLCDIFLPESLATVGRDAFSNCSGLQNVYIKNPSAWCHVTFGGENCVDTALSSKLRVMDDDGNAVSDIVLDDSVTAIPENAFYNCNRITSVTVADGVTSIGRKAFYRCTGLTEVTIGNGVSTIGNSAFYDCTKLSSVTLGSGVTSIGGHAFYNCSSLSGITIPEGVTGIESYTFYNCTRLSSMFIPDGVKYIRTYAFYTCSSLRMIRIPASITDIDQYAFYDCVSLQDLYITDPSAWCRIQFGNDSAYPNYYAKNCHILDAAGNEVTKLVLDSSVTKLPAYAFRNFTALTHVAIPDSVTTIGGYAFRSCSGLRSVNIGNGVTDIGNYAFAYCDSLETVSLGNSVATIGSNAFCECIELMEIRIPDTVVAIGDKAFYLCRKMKNINIPEGVTDIKNSVFYGCAALTEITLPNSITSVGEYAFKNCAALATVNLGSSLTTVGYEAFKACTGLTEIVVPGSLANLGTNAFSGCTGLVSVTVQNGVTNIGIGMFDNCTALASVTLPDSVTTIGKKAFIGCKGLASISLPDKLTTIEEYAFSDCYSLEMITIPDSVTVIGQYAFFNCNGLKDVYITDPNAWCRIRFGGGSDKNYCYPNYYARNFYILDAEGNEVTELVLDSSVAAIPRFAFRRCKNLTSVTVSESVRSIAGYVFDDCSKLKNIVFLGQAPSFDSFAFDDVAASVWYPAEDLSWTSTVMKNYFGNPIWKKQPACDIMRQPQNVETEAGAAAQFAVEIFGDVVSYRWEYSSGGRWMDTKMDGYNTPVLTVPVTSRRNGYQYRCVVTFAGGTRLISDAARLTVKNNLAITSHPKSKAVLAGGSAKLSVTVTGDGITYQWQSSAENGVWKDIENTNKASFLVQDAVEKRGWQYRCKITDAAGEVVYSDAAMLFVREIVNQPEDTKKSVNAIATFTVKMNDSQGISYQWQYSRNGTAWYNTAMTGYNSCLLEVPVTSARDGYAYRCVITDEGGNKLISQSATLKVDMALELIGWTQQCNAVAGEIAQIEVNAVNAVSYRWQYARPGSEKWCDTKMEGYNTDTLSVAVTAARNGYRYRCVITGRDGTKIISEPTNLNVEL